MRTPPLRWAAVDCTFTWTSWAAPGGTLVTVHLKSKLLSFPGGRFNPTDEDERARYAAYALYRRAAEAATVRVAATGILDGHGQDRRLVVLGDLNDTEHAATTQLLYGPPGSQYGTGGFSHPDRGDGQRLWNLAPQIPAERRYSRIFEGQRELIDHILISHALLTRLQSVDTQPNQVASITANPQAAGETHLPPTTPPSSPNSADSQHRPGGPQVPWCTVDAGKAA